MLDSLAPGARYYIPEEPNVPPVAQRQRVHSRSQSETQADNNALGSLASSKMSVSTTPFRENSIKLDTTEDTLQGSVESRDVNEPHGPSILRQRQIEAFRDGKGGLPAEKGFPIQIGSELFRLSGASIMSDGLRIISP